MSDVVVVVVVVVVIIIIIIIIIICVGLIPQPRSPTKGLWIEKSIKEGQDSIRTVEAS
jgi:hypothetical protein